MKADVVPFSEPKPAIVYDGAAIQFFMSPIFLLVALIEAIDRKHQYVEHDDRSHI
jgi:hypothetical protein